VFDRLGGKQFFQTIPIIADELLLQVRTTIDFGGFVEEAKKGAQSVTPGDCVPFGDVLEIV